MEAKVIIERIDREHIHVEFIDPWGNGNYRVPVRLPDDLTLENFEVYIMRQFPLNYFRERNHILTRELPRDHAEITAQYTGKTLSLTIPEPSEAPEID